MNKGVVKRYSGMVILLFILSSHQAYADGIPQTIALNNNYDFNKYLDISLAELAEIPIFSASKREENSFRAASSVFTITSEDIRRSGMTSVPELLRIVPGLEVARIDSSKWAITARGFNRQFSKKLLVMVDGRTIYNNLFSGVYWDTRGDVPLEHIDHVEVIRGSGGALWGANAVNGVINIITKEAIYSQKEIASIYLGNSERGAYFAMGGKLDTKGRDYGGNYRSYIKRKDLGQMRNLAGNGADDDWYMNRVGGRLDLDFSRRNQDLKNLVTYSFDAYAGSMDQEYFLPNLDSLEATQINGREDAAGGNVLAKWEKSLAQDGSEFTLQFFFDHVKRKSSLLERRRNIYDLDFQQSFLPLENHLLSFGLGYQMIEDNLESSRVGEISYISYEPESNEGELLSAFIQDSISYFRERLTLTLGSKFEHNDFTHYEIQPSVRLSYFINSNQTIWSALSKSVRSPNRGEDGITLLVDRAGDGIVAQVGSKDFTSEDSISLEMGYRNKALANATFDISGFYTRYDKLRTQKLGASYYNSEGVLIIPLNLENDGSGDVYGAEVSLNFDLTQTWRLISGYTFLKIGMDLDSTYSDSSIRQTEGSSPRNQFNLRSQHHGESRFGKYEFDNSLYYTGSLSELGIPEYVRFDTRLSFKPKDTLEISFIGQNLFDPEHPEFSHSIYSEEVEVGRSFLIQVKRKLFF